MKKPLVERGFFVYRVLLTLYPSGYQAQRPPPGFNPRALSQIVPVIAQGKVDAPAVGTGAKLKAMSAPAPVVAVLVPVTTPLAMAIVLTFVEVVAVGTPKVPGLQFVKAPVS